jgi:hypothetical protein
MEQLRAFHQQHHALVTDVTAKQMKQRAMTEQLLQFQKRLNAQQNTLDKKLLAQERTRQSHDKALLHASRSFGDPSRSPQELKSDLEMTKRRQSGGWSAFVDSVTAVATSRLILRLPPQLNTSSELNFLLSRKLTIRLDYRSTLLLPSVSYFPTPTIPLTTVLYAVTR